MERITVNPKILGGKPIIKGTRITVEFILELLASDVSEGNGVKSLSLTNVHHRGTEGTEKAHFRVLCSEFSVSRKAAKGAEEIVSFKLQKPKYKFQIIYKFQFPKFQTQVFRLCEY